MRRVVVHVDRLVLSGFRPGERHRFAEALRAELARVLAEPGAAGRLAARGDAPRLAVGPVHAAGEASAIATRAARAIAGGIAP